MFTWRHYSQNDVLLHFVSLLIWKRVSRSDTLAYLMGVVCHKPSWHDMNKSRFKHHNQWIIQRDLKHSREKVRHVTVPEGQASEVAHLQSPWAATPHDLQPPPTTLTLLSHGDQQPHHQGHNPRAQGHCRWIWCSCCGDTGGGCGRWRLR